MKQYLVSIYQPDEGRPPTEVLEKVMRDIGVLIQDMKAAGAWVFNGGLLAPGSAKVMRLRGRQVLVTDGPFAEGKEHIGGFFIVAAPDLESALEWGRRAAQATTLPIEVRAFQGELED